MITRLSGTGFLPFRGAFDVPLGNQGLILIRGDNRISTAANDNGSGKTSIAHAIAWCLYGEDLLGRKADAVANRFTEDTCAVRLDFEDALGTWAVTRTRRPASLEVEGLNVAEGADMNVVQEAVIARVGFGLRTFRNAVVFGQGAFDRFANADQAEQMKMLDEIQGIDFTEMRKRTKAWRDQLVEEYEKTNRQADLDNAALTAGRREVTTLRGLRDSYDATRATMVKGLKARMLVATQAIEAAVAEGKQVKADLIRLEKLRIEENKCVDLEGAYSLARNDEQIKGALQDEAGRELRRFDESLEELVAGAICPKCRGKVDDAPRILERFGKDRGALRRTSERASREYTKAREVSAKALEALEAQQEIRARAAGVEYTPFGAEVEASQIIFTLERETSPVARKRIADAEEKARREALALSIEAKKVETQPWDGAAKLEAAEASVTLLTASIARTAGRLEKIMQAIAIADYWTEAFSDRGIRSLLVDSITDMLNDRIRYHLEMLAAGEASVTMSTQTALKKGGTKERISFTPVWAWGGEGAGTGSAGQDRRVDLAVFAAVQDLAESWSARPFPLKIYDEPFDALDSRGKEMACAWVRAQAKEYGTAILITHSEELAGLAEPDQVWTIVHDDRGARVEQKTLFS